ncbi:MAG: SH3 domain-containing protein [Alphaproteobacteria bacterium]|nr:SH3 domain-containing protein [Alphaproteobacteria bacterium]MBF0250259.1 SH3 domain-containing protein [Alphaproteobacteria bacterium]
MKRTRAIALAAVLWAAAVPAAWAEDEEALPEVTEGMDLPSAAAADDEHEAITVMDQQLIPYTGLFEISTDMNLRQGPSTDHEKLGLLEKGARVQAIGRTEDGEWTAVGKDGETLGFAYSPLLVPVVDGAIGEQFFGSYTSDGGDSGVVCDYRFRYEGKVGVDGGEFNTSDYEIRFRCASTKGARIFYAHMYLTEGPVDKDAGLHQIGLEVRSIGDGYEDYLATRYLYNPKTGDLKFEGHSLPFFADPPKVQDFKTESVKDALTQALENSVASWTNAAWGQLFKKQEAVE